MRVDARTDDLGAYSTVQGRFVDHEALALDTREACRLTVGAGSVCYITSTSLEELVGKPAENASEVYQRPHKAAGMHFPLILIRISDEDRL